MSPLLEVAGVSKSYGGVQALADCHMRVNDGAIHGLIGPNGSGKTTLFNVITGYERINEGEVHFNGSEITNSRPDHVFGLGVGRTFQITRIFGRLTVLENMLVATQRKEGWVRSILRIAGSTAEKRRAMELLEFVGIERLADGPAGTLSYGQRKLLELASLLVADPDVLLLDEPAGGVNPTLITHLADRIRELNKTGKTFLVVEHNMEFVMNLCHEVTVLSQGTPLVSGPPEAVRANPAVLDAYLGGEDDAATQKELAHAHGPAPEPATPRRPEPAVQAAGPEPLLRIDGVTAGYGGGDILKRVGFDVAEGGITCIVGPNGAGKSTLLSTISGLLRPREGEIRFKGRVISGLSPRQILDLGISQVPQAHSLFPEMTVRENVEMGAFTIRDAGLVRERLEAVEEAYPIVRERADEKAGSLSGGQQRLVEFARCLMLDPALIILDEPSMGLDPQIRQTVFEMVETMHAQGKTILLVEQNARAGLKLSSHGVVLENGTVRLTGTGREVLEHPEIGALYLGGAVSTGTGVMSAEFDIVVAGAGHNSLIAAAYLTRAGYRCRVLDARPVAGGGVASEESLLPGYKLDSCSTGHTLIQQNPLLTGDELGLISERGLTYLEPDPVAHVVFPDGESLTMWLDVERTYEEIAHFSRADADAYRSHLAEYDAVKDVFTRYRFTPVGFGPSLEQMLIERTGGPKWLRRAALSAWDVVRHHFAERHVQAFMLWMAFQTAQPVDSAGSGPLAYSIVFGRQRRSWTIPAGGSGELVRALVEIIEEGGGEVLCDRRVVALVIEDGRCTGVETAGGERHLASEAVLSTIHVKDLVEMAPSDLWGEDFLYGVETYDPGVAAFAAHYLTTEPPRYHLRDGSELTSVSAGVAGWPERIVRMGRDIKEGRLVRDGAWLLFPTPTVEDPSRAPAGHHTVKLLGMQPYDPGGGPQEWELRREEIAEIHLGHLRRAAPNLTDEKILARLIVAPPDLERSNPHMWRGTFHGGDRSLAHSGALRPVPGWAQHRMPIAGLYQTGGTTHPGGSVTGAPGRNAAIVMLSDLGQDPQTVMAVATAVRAGSR